MSFTRRSALAGAGAYLAARPTFAASGSRADAFWAAMDRTPIGPDGINFDGDALFRTLSRMTSRETKRCIQALQNLYDDAWTSKLQAAGWILTSGRPSDDTMHALIWSLMIRGQTTLEEGMRDPDTLSGDFPFVRNYNEASILFSDASYRHFGTTGPDPILPEPERWAAEDWTLTSARRAYPRLAAWVPHVVAHMHGPKWMTRLNV